MTANRRGRPPTWDGADVTRAALRLADTEGLGALSMRRLADEMGVAVTTIYNHVGSKEDLVERLRVFTLAALDVDPTSTKPWRDQLFTAIVGVYDAFREHPCGSELLFSAPAILDPGFRRLADRLVQMLGGEGFSAENSAAVIEALLVYAAGAANHERVQLRRTGELDRQAQESPDPEQLERINQARALVHPIPREIFEIGLAGAIDAFATKYGTGAPPRPRRR